MHCCESCMNGREINLSKNLYGLHCFLMMFFFSFLICFSFFFFAFGLDSLWILWTVGVMIPRVLLLIMRIKNMDASVMMFSCYLLLPSLNLDKKKILKTSS